MTKEKGFRSDGNGGFVIQKGTFTLIMLLIALLSTITTVVAYGVTMKSDINNLKEDSQQFIEFDNRIDTCETHVATSSIILNDMQADITEMRLDVKQLLKIYSEEPK